MSPKRAHHFWSVILVLGSSVGFGVFATQTQTAAATAGPLAAIVGTLVALILPAAELAGSYLHRREQDIINDFVENRLNTKDSVGLAQRSLDRARVATEPTIRGFVYLLVAFPLTLLALLDSKAKVSGVGIEELLVGLAAGLGFGAVLSFVPMIRLTLGLALFDRAERVVAIAEEKLCPPVDGAEAGPPAPLRDSDAGKSVGPPKPQLPFRCPPPVLSAVPTEEPPG